MKLADDAEHSRWHTKTSWYSPQEGSVYGVIGFGEVDKAHKRRDDFLPRRFPQATDHNHVCLSSIAGSKTTLLLLRQDAFAFAVVAEVPRDDFAEYFAGVCHERDATTVCFLLCSTLIVAYFHYCGTSPPLPQRRRYRRSLPGCPNFLRQPGSSGVQPGGHPAQPPCCSPSLGSLLPPRTYCRRDIVQRYAPSPYLELVDVSRVGDLAFGSLLNHFTQRSRVEPMSRSRLPSSSLKYCEWQVRFPSTSIPV